MPRFLLLLALAALAGCDSLGIDRVDERLTDAVLTLTPQDGGAPVTITATDADADGADFFFTPAFVRLRAGTVYDGALTLRDGATDLTPEIRAAAEIHRARVQIAPGGAGAAEPTDRESDYTDEDTNGADLPVGLTFRLRVDPDAAGAGTVDVTLFHFDPGAKTRADALSDARDLDVRFPVAFAPPTGA